MSRMKLLLFAVVSALAIVATACASGGLLSSEPDEPLTIRVFHGKPTSTLYGIMNQIGVNDEYAALRAEIMPNYGKDYVIDPRRSDASSENAGFLASGEADVAFTATGPLIIANTKLNGDLRIIADTLQGGHQGYNGLWFVVLEDSDIQTAADMKGKTAGTLAFGTFADLAMKSGLVAAGLDTENDLTIVQVGFANMDASLREGKIDMAQMVQPFWNIAQGKGGVRSIYTAAESVGRTQALFLTTREKYLNDNPRRMQAYLDDYYSFMQWALDPANRDAAMTIGTGMMDMELVAAAAFGTKDNWYYSPDVQAYIPAVVAEMELLFEFGFLDETVDVESWVDQSMIVKAAENYKN